MKSKHFLTVMAVTCMLFYVPLTVSAAVPEDTKTVTVSATASVFAAPDKASVILKVISEGTDSSAVQKENSEKTERVRLALKEQGVEESDLRTSGFYLSPKYDYSSDDMRIIGYLATNQLELTGQDLDVIGTLIAAGNEAGADGVENLNFYCSNYDDLYLEALTKAVGAAEVKARTMVTAAGFESIEADMITEGYQDDSFRYNTKSYLSESAAYDSFDDSDYVPIYAGETEIEASVTIVYEMK